MQYSPSPPPYNDPIALLNEGDDDEVPINRQGPAVVKIEYHTYYNGSNVASEHHKHPSYAVSRNNPLFGANQQRRIQEALKKKKAQMARKIKKTMFAEAEREKALEDVNDRRERMVHFSNITAFALMIFFFGMGAIYQLTFIENRSNSVMPSFFSENKLITCCYGLVNALDMRISIVLILAFIFSLIVYNFCNYFVRYLTIGNTDYSKINKLFGWLTLIHGSFSFAFGWIRLGEWFYEINSDNHLTIYSFILFGIHVLMFYYFKKIQTFMQALPAV